MIELSGVHPRSKMLGLKRERRNGLDINIVKNDEKTKIKKIKKINAFYMFFEKMDTMVSIFDLKKFLNVPVKIIKKYNFFQKMSSDGEDSTSTKIFTEAATQPSMVELPITTDADSFATRSSATVEDWAKTEQSLDLHEDEDDISAAFTKEINELFEPVKEPEFINRTGVKLVFPMTKNRRELMLLGQSPRGEVDKKVSWGVDRKSPEEKRARKLKDEEKKLKEKPAVKESVEKKEMIAVEGVLKRKEATKEKKPENKRRIERSSSTAKKSKDQPPKKASWGNGAKATNDWGFSCTDIRFRDKTPVK